ncbi:MAG: hypothetical protein ACKKMR_00860 [Candidatus Nealsonbacteria bacterium]
MKLIQSSEKIYWTRHARGKMRYYRLSENRVKRVLRKPDRKELGIALNTIAVMQRTGTKKHPSEIWLMYQKASFKYQIPKSNKKARIIRIISAWRYPGKSPKGQPPPIPEDTLWELKKLNEGQNSN